MRALILWGWLCLIISLSSCEEDFMLQSNNDYLERIVVNSVFHPDSSWQVRLTTSRNIFKTGSDIKPIDDALVSVLDKNGQNVASFTHLSNGIYSSKNVFPKYGEVYTLVIFSPSYGSVRAVSKVPPQAEVSHLEVNEDIEKNQTTVNFNIQDTNSENNFYLWELVSLTSEESEQFNSEQTNFYFDVRTWVTNLDRQIQHIRNNKIKSELVTGPKNFNAGSVGLPPYKLDYFSIA